MEPDKYLLLKEYLTGGKSLNKVNICVPVLITYDSTCIKSFCGNKNADIESEDFRKDFEKEVNDNFAKIYGKNWPSSSHIKIVFFIIPFESVAEIKEKIERVESAMKF